MKILTNYYKILLKEDGAFQKIMCAVKLFFQFCAFLPGYFLPIFFSFLHNCDIICISPML